MKRKTISAILTQAGTDSRIASRGTTLLRAGALLAAATVGAAQPSSAQPAAAQPGRADAQIPGEGEVSFSEFSEPVDLQVLVDFVSKRLGINFLVQNAGLAGQTVVFRAPMTVRDDQLLDLLQMILQTYNFSITRDPQNGWYIIGAAGDLPIVMDGDGELATTQVIPTPLVRPSALQPAVTSMLPTSANMRVAYVDELGVVISTAPPSLNRSLEQIIRLILDGRRDQRLHRFDLTHIAAVEARDRILELVGQGQRGGRQGAAAAAAAAAGAAGAATGAGGSLSNLPDRLIIDRAGNALIFRGDDNEAVEVRRYIELADTPSRLVIRRYNAGPMAPTIAAYGEQQGLGPVISSPGGGLGGGRSAAAAGGAGSSSLAGSGFFLDAGDALAFTYFGTAEQHLQISALVEEFAEQSRGARVIVEFYKLRHSNAAAVADLLSSLLETDQQGVAQSPFLPRSVESAARRRITPVGDISGSSAQTPAGGTDAATTATGEEPTGLTPAEGVGIIADEANNQIIIKAPARQQSEFARIIEKLDRRRAQVLIEVVIVSVNRSHDFEFGFDYALESDKYPLFTNLGIRGGTDPFTTMVPNAAGITAAIVRSNYIPVIVNAFEAKGNGRVLSRPRLLVNDNETASISSTRNEPFAETSQVAGAPSTTSLGGEVSAGTQLEITPQVSEGGFLVLEFSVELSSFGERPNPDLPPATLSDNVSSIVTIPSDSTVIVGGLTFETKNDSVNQVPFLGNIPGLGWLFQSNIKENSKQTLFVFITPRILRDGNFADLRLLSAGPMREAGVEDVTPPLQPAIIELFLGPEATASAEKPAGGSAVDLFKSLAGAND